MFVLELAFSDDPARLAARPAHRQRLGRLREQGVLVMAGPWADDSGALLIFDVDSDDDLTRLIDDDPYYRSPGVSVTRRQRWSPIAS